MYLETGMKTYFQYGQRIHVLLLTVINKLTIYIVMNKIENILNGYYMLYFCIIITSFINSLC